MSAYTDEELADAVASSHSWRGVLRALGLRATSAGSQRSARGHADRLGLDYSHFTGQRTWTDRALAEAVAGSTSWTDVARRLHLSPGSSNATLRGSALQLGLDSTHFSVSSARPSDTSSRPTPTLERLPRAGALLAAAWYELCGYEVGWPLEPSSYDLLVRRGPAVRKVQVKTTRRQVGTTWSVKLSSTTRRSVTYDPDDVDDLFVVAAGGEYCLIPFTHVAGRAAISLSAYERFRVTPWPAL